MKATLEFDLDDKEDEKAHIRCVKATDAYSALHDFQNELRVFERQLESTEDETEYNHKWALFESIKQRFYGLMAEHGVNTDDL